MKRLALFLLLLLPLVVADGFFIPSPIAGRISESHQLLAVNLNEESADARMFVSLESENEAEIVFIIPFKNKPSFFEFEERNVTEFKEITHITEVEKKTVEHQRYNKLAGEVTNRVALSFVLVAFAPIAPVILGLGVIGGIEGAGTFGAAGRPQPEEVQVFARGKLEVYNVSEKNIDDLISFYKADPSLKTRFKEYGRMHLYVFTVRPYARDVGQQWPSLDKPYSSLHELINGECSKPREALELLAKAEDIEYREWNGVCNRIPFESRDAFRPSLYALREMFADVRGLDIHYGLELKGGEFWYQLGTGQFWDTPIGITGLYLFVPDGQKLVGKPVFQRIPFGGGKAVYVKEIFSENPDYDVVVSVKEDPLRSISNALAAVIALFLDLFSVLAYLVPLFGVFLGGVYVLKKKGVTDSITGSAMVVGVSLVAPLVALILTGIVWSLLSLVASIFFFASFWVVLLVILVIWIALHLFLLKFGAEKIVKMELMEFAHVLVHAVGVGFAVSVVFLLGYHALAFIYYAL